MKRISRVVASVVLPVTFAAGVPLVACSSAPEEGAAASSQGALIALSPSEIVGTLVYGQTSAPVAYRDTPRYRAFTFSGTKGDAVSARVASTIGHPDAWILNADFSTLASGPADGLWMSETVTATLPKTGTFYVAFRDYFQEDATFVVSLARSTRTTDGGAPIADAGPGDAGPHDSGTGDADGGPTDAGTTVASVHFYGRFDTTDYGATPTTPIFDWSNSGIVADFQGTGIAVTLSGTQPSSDGNPITGQATGPQQMDAFIDGVPAAIPVTLISGTSTYPIMGGLADGRHHLELYKRTEALYGYIQFLGFSNLVGGSPDWTLVPTPDPYPRKLEFIGDLTTAGLGLGSTAVVASCSDEDASQAFGALTARALGASSVSIALSGVGIYRDVEGITTDPMAALYPRTVENLASSVYDFATKPDAVVINLGTSDFFSGDPGQPFVTAYEQLISTIRSHYPDAYILLVNGSWLNDDFPFTGAFQRLQSYLLQIVSAFGNDHIGAVQVAEQADCASETCGCLPGAADQQSIAAAVTSALKTAKGW